MEKKIDGGKTVSKKRYTSPSQLFQRGGTPGDGGPGRVKGYRGALGRIGSGSPSVKKEGNK